jgi:hypothetical protein
MRSIAFSLLAIGLTGGQIQSSQAVLPPELYISKGACPFECCTYRKWRANRTVTLMDHPGGKPMAQVRNHEQVLAITGEVRTHPLRVTIKKKGSQNGSVPVGSTVYLLHPIGEGFWLVWYEGKTIEMDPQYEGPGPQYQWWAKVKTQSGKIGWARMNASDLAFENVDLCA